MRALLIFFMCMVVGVLPSLVKAQSVETSTSTPVSVTQPQMWLYRHQSADMQQKITALSNVANPQVLMPVLFGVGLKDISPNFGDPRPGGRKHEGEDIMAIKGTPIVSPTNAVVLSIGVGASEGNYVYTANPGGETFVYMHLDRIGEGVMGGSVLSPGSLIGYVGNTGDAAGGAAHLHFEIHNVAGNPTDPFPRLTGEISLQDKIIDLSQILAKTTNSTALSQFLVINFRSTFNDATTANIVLPASITNALSTLPVTSPSNDLGVGSSGGGVVALQTYLIQKASGPAASVLATAGATGTFGPATRAALLEFQTAVGIQGANGHYGLATQIYVAMHPVGSTSQTPQQPVPPPVVNATTTTPTTGTSTAIFSRNLQGGARGEDVRALQRILNNHGYVITSTGPGSPGNETDLFGGGTFAAVIKFQLAHNISPAAGFVGPITRGVLESL